jgi:hypothetical protein
MRSIVLSLLLATVLPGVVQDQTGSIEGTITNAYTGDPIRDIQVSIDSGHSGTTDRSGYFRITKVPPGEYALNVSQHEYILNPGAFTFGSSTDAGILKLQPRQQIRDLQLEMVPSGTISGHVRNSDGTPVSNSKIQFFQYRFSEFGEPKLVFILAGSLASNDKGEYRQWGIAPGQYFVLASPPPAAGNSGTGIGPIPTFYPGARTVERAIPVTVGRGNDVDRMDITLLRTQRNSLTVNLVLPPGVRTVLGRLQLIPESIDSSGGDMTGCIMWTCVTAARNQQTIYNVPTGRYSVVATADSSSGRGEYSGHAPVDIGDGPSDPITIYSTAVESADISGRVRFADTGEELKVASAPFDLQSSTRRYPSPRIPSGADPSLGFVIEHIAFGEYQIGAYPPPGTYLADVLQANRSILNGVLKVSAESHEPLDAVLGRDGGTVAGIVRSVRGAPIGFGQVVLVRLLQHRLLTQTIRADYSGRFNFENVPPGNYRLYSWLSLPANAWQNAEFMKKYDALGTPVTVEPQKTTEELVVTRIVDE